MTTAVEVPTCKPYVRESDEELQAPVRLEVTVYEEGKSPRTVAVDPEESFMAEIYQAARNGKDVVGALCLLADEGGRHIRRTNPVAAENRIGK